MVCFPELNVTGYSNRDVMGRTALSIPGPATDELLHIAAFHGTVVLAGMAETKPGGGVYASHVVAHPDGCLGVYRKLHTAPPERTTFDRGNHIPIFTASGISFGIQLCYDAHFPELSTHMAAKGADLILIPHASPRGDAATKHQSWMRHLPARAYDNSVFVAACNQVGDNEQALSFPGNAVMIDPSGNIIATDLSGREGMLVADLKVRDLSRVRGHEMRYFLPNRRRKIYEKTRTSNVKRPAVKIPK
jgi:N-carbamoylputrescine amidase